MPRLFNAMPRLFNGFNFAGYISILARRYHRLCFCAIAITVGCRSLPSAHDFGNLAAVYARFHARFVSIHARITCLRWLVLTVICAVDVKPTSNICIAELVQSLRTNSTYHLFPFQLVRLPPFLPPPPLSFAFSCHPHRQRFQFVIHLTLYRTFAYLPWIHTQDSSPCVLDHRDRELITQTSTNQLRQQPPRLSCGSPFATAYFTAVCLVSSPSTSA